MPYKEKSAIGTLIVILLVYWYYFSEVLALVQTGDIELRTLIPVIVGVVVFTIILQVFYEIIIGIIHRDDEMEDERDRIIEARADRISGYVLAIGIYCCIGYIIANGIGEVRGSIPDLEFVIVNLLVLCLGAAEVVKYGLQIAGYHVAISR